MAGIHGGSRAKPSPGCSPAFAAWSGRIRPGPTTRHGWASRFNSIGRRCHRRAIISRPTPRQIPRDARIMTWFPWELHVASDRTTILMPRNYNPPARIDEVIKQYRVTHILWGSLEMSAPGRRSRSLGALLGADPRPVAFD